LPDFKSARISGTGRSFAGGFSTIKCCRNANIFGSVPVPQPAVKVQQNNRLRKKYSLMGINFRSLDSDMILSAAEHQRVPAD
jgi:hypothetical protein